MSSLTAERRSHTLLSVARWFGIGVLVACVLWLAGGLVSSFGIEAQVALNRLRYALWPTAILLLADPMNTSVLIPLSSIAGNGILYGAVRACWIVGTRWPPLGWLPIGVLFTSWAYYLHFLYSAS